MLVSGNLPYFAYYGNHRIVYDGEGIISTKSLVEIMKLSRIDYVIIIEELLVDFIEGPSLASLAKEGLENFDKDFDLLGVHASDSRKFMTYKLKIAGGDSD